MVARICPAGRGRDQHGNGKRDRAKPWMKPCRHWPLTGSADTHDTAGLTGT
jgi:hypothetical protein